MTASCVAFPLALLWRPLFAGEAFFWGTPLLQFVPWQRMAAAMWRAGHLPLWNPLVGCGAPLAANYQTATFYPLNALYLLLPAEVALSWTAVLHLALAGWGMYNWGRIVGLDRFPALIGALALEGSAFLVGRVALFPSMVFAFSWLSVWLWRAEALLQRRRPYEALGLGLTLGLGLLAGHAQMACYGGMLLAAYLVFRAAQDGKIQHTIRSLLLAFSALVVGIALAAVQLLPTAELMLQSQRSVGVDYDFAMTYSLWPWRLITFAAPDFFGNPGRGDYWGYATYWEDAGYVGLLPLLLAAEAVFAGKRGRRPAGDGQVWFWAASAVIALLLALGKNTPVFPFLFRHVPGFNLFQAPARWLAVTTLALAALAALGAQRWLAGQSGERRGALGIVVGVALLAGGLVAPRVVPDMPSTFDSATAWLGGILALAGLVALLRRDAAWWRAAAGFFLALDLLLFGWPLVPTVDRSLYHGGTQAAALLRAEPDQARIYWPADPTHCNREYDAEYRVKFDYLTFGDFGSHGANDWWGMREALLPNAGMLDGVACANNFDPLLVGRYVDLLGAVVEAPGLLRVMGVTHVASDRPWPLGEPVFEGAQATLYRLSDAPGRAWVVPAARRVPAGEILTAVVEPGFDPSVEVLLEAPIDHLQSPALNSRPLVLQDTPNRVTIRASLDAPGYLVLADTWYPGWRATVDGEPTDILRANYAFRAVWLEAGEHTVEMIYQPTSVLVGGVISLAALALLAVGLLRTRLQEAWA